MCMSSCLRHCYERTCLNMCVIKNRYFWCPKVHQLSSGDVTPPAVLPTLVPSLLEIRSQLAQQMHTWTARNWMQYSGSHVATTALVLSQMASEAISEYLTSKIFLGEHALVLHAYVCIPCGADPVVKFPQKKRKGGITGDLSSTIGTPFSQIHIICPTRGQWGITVHYQNVLARRGYIYCKASLSLVNGDFQQRQQTHNYCFHVFSPFASPFGY